MSNIVVGFSKSRKFKLLSWLIRKAEHTAFSHVYVKIYDARIYRWMVYEASGLNTHCSTQDAFYLKNKEIAEFVVECSPETENEVLTTASDALNANYGIMQLIGMGLVRLCSSVGISIKNPFRDGRKTYVCSEYVGVLLNKLGYEVGDLDALTPKHIYELLQNG